MAKVNWGIIGCGNIAHTFATSIAHCSDAQLIGAASTSIQRAKEFATPYNIQGYESYQALMQCPNIDAIYIANTHDQHFKTIAQCLKHLHLGAVVILLWRVKIASKRLPLKSSFVVLQAQ